MEGEEWTSSSDDVVWGQEERFDLAQKKVWEEKMTRSHITPRLLYVVSKKQVQFKQSVGWYEEHVRAAIHPPSPPYYFTFSLNVLARAQTKGEIHHYSKFFFPNLSYPPPARITARV